MGGVRVGGGGGKLYFPELLHAAFLEHFKKMFFFQKNKNEFFFCCLGKWSGTTLFAPQTHPTPPLKLAPTLYSCLFWKVPMP